jgi:hypothetical protein
MISNDTINLCLQLLGGVSVPIMLPDAEAKMQRLVAARQELLAVAQACAQPNSGEIPGIATGMDYGMRYADV